MPVHHPEMLLFPFYNNPKPRANGLKSLATICCMAAMASGSHDCNDREQTGLTFASTSLRAGADITVAFFGLGPADVTSDFLSDGNVISIGKIVKADILSQDPARLALHPKVPSPTYADEQQNSASS